jgi:hypothetical protein
LEMPQRFPIVLFDMRCREDGGFAWHSKPALYIDDSVKLIEENQGSKSYPWYFFIKKMS